MVQGLINSVRKWSPAGSSTSQVVSIPVTNNSICDLTNEIQISLMNIDGGYNAVAGTNAVLTIDINDDETIEPVFH